MTRALSCRRLVYRPAPSQGASCVSLRGTSVSPPAGSQTVQILAASPRDQNRPESSQAVEANATRLAPEAVHASDRLICLAPERTHIEWATHPRSPRFLCTDARLTLAYGLAPARPANSVAARNAASTSTASSRADAAIGSCCREATSSRRTDCLTERFCPIRTHDRITRAVVSLVFVKPRGSRGWSPRHVPSLPTRCIAAQAHAGRPDHPDPGRVADPDDRLRGDGTRSAVESCDLE